MVIVVLILVCHGIAYANICFIFVCQVHVHVYYICIQLLFILASLQKIIFHILHYNQVTMHLEYLDISPK